MTIVFLLWKILALKQRAFLILISKIYLDHDDFFTYEVGLDVATQVRLIASKSNVSGPVYYKNLYENDHDGAKCVVPTVSPTATAGTSIVPTQAAKFYLINLKGFIWTDIFREITRISLQDRTLFTFSKLLGKNKLNDARLEASKPQNEYSLTVLRDHFLTYLRNEVPNDDSLQRSGGFMDCMDQWEMHICVRHDTCDLIIFRKGWFS